MRLMTVSFSVVLLVGAVVSAEDTTKPVDEVAAVRAENKLLRATVDRQGEELRKLRGQIELLNDRLKLLGITKEMLEASDATPAHATGAKTTDRATARTIFLLDGSGSMINTFPTAKEELVRAVRALPPTQSFDVLVAQDEGVTAFEPRPVLATPQKVRKFFIFLDGVSSTGTTNLAVGLKEALKLRPTVLWIVTDGDVPDNNALAKAARESNRGTRINAMLLGERNVGAETAFVAMTAATGGVCVDMSGKAVASSARAQATHGPAQRTPGRGYGTMKDEDLPNGPSKLFQEFRD